MPLHQRTAFPASHSTSSLPESGPPPVPAFSESSPDDFNDQLLDMAALNDMINDPRFASATWPAPSGPNMDYDVEGYLVSGAQNPAYPPTGLLRVDSTSSTDTPQTVSPAQLQNSGPPSGYMGSQFTPATDYTNSPANYSAAYSNQTSPDDFGLATPYMNDGLDFDQSQLGSVFFGALPEIPVAPAPRPSPKQTAARSRNKSTPGKSPRTPLSTVVDGRVRKPPRTKPLPDICPDPDDPKKVKTARNTAAARKSRARKVERFQTLAEENDNYKLQVEELQSEADIWKARALRMGWVPGPE